MLFLERKLLLRQLVHVILLYLALWLLRHPFNKFLLRLFPLHPLHDQFRQPRDQGHRHSVARLPMVADLVAAETQQSCLVLLSKSRS